MKTIITVTGIRPDFIRMSNIFKRLDLDRNILHILVHTGQHYSAMLSDVFFDELEIRKPNYNLGIGGPNKEHFHQTADLSIKLIELIRSKELKPDLIIFLGDSNSVVSAVALKKEGYKIAHIEAGMRSGDKRMLEEINRMVCDVCSDYHFVYHDNYKKKLAKENIVDNVYVVGNTIVEIVKPHIPARSKSNDRILLDIHRPENFLYKDRLKNIIKYTNNLANLYSLPVYLIGFPRTLKAIEEFKIKLGCISVQDLMPFKYYLQCVYDSRFIISDSGTAQEEPALLGTQVIVPRDFTERPESVANNCSFMLDVNDTHNKTWGGSIVWLDREEGKQQTAWLGNGSTSEQITDILRKIL